MAMSSTVLFVSVASLGPLVSLWFWHRTQSAFERLRVRDGKPNSIELQHSPTRWSSFDLVSITVTILNKYIPGLNGRVAKLQPDATRDQSFSLPSIYVKGFLDIDDADFEKFFKAVRHDGPTKDTVSPMFLVAMTGPLLPYVLAQPACPVKPFGSVNTQNTFVVKDPKFCRNVQAIKDASKNHQLTCVATFGGPNSPGQRKKRGVEFSINIQVLWNENPVLLVTTNFLQFLSPSTLPKFVAVPGAADVKAPRVSGNQNASTTQQSSTIPLAMNPQHPREWASCCRDYNPIHMSKVMAKLFGFKSVIAHGNHAIALALQQIYGEAMNERTSAQAGAGKLIWEQSSPISIDMKFVKPMVLPVDANVEWEVEEDGNTFNFVISRGKTQYTIGTCALK